MNCLKKDPRNGHPNALFRAGIKRVKWASWNVGSLTGRSAEVVEVLERRRIDLCCVQETRWRGCGTKWIVGKESKYKLFWIGSKEGLDGVGIIIKESWADKVLEVNRINSRLILLKLILEEKVVSIISAYAPQAGKSREEKDEFWDTLSDICREIPDKEKL